LSFGDTGGFLSKLVKPTKVFCSWPPHESGFREVLPPQTKPHIGATAARILRKPYATVRKELGGLNPPDGVFYQLTELLALLFGDGGSQD
jgi:hypothetical protein